MKVTARTSPVAGSVTVPGALPPVAFMPPWHPAQLKPPSAVGAEQLLAPPGEGVSGLLLGPGLAGRLEHPVERQSDHDHDEQQHADELHELEALAFQLLVVVVGLAVGRQLDLGAELLARRPLVERGVDQEADEDDREDDPAAESERCVAQRARIGGEIISACRLR